MQLTIVGLPLGNAQDISHRAVEALKSADLVICEDTRVFLKLWQKLMNLGYLEEKYQGKFAVINDYNERIKSEELAITLESYQSPILISDAGMPTISDPGFRLINYVRSEGGKVSVVPGPTAVMSAVAVSGLSADRVLFLGFLPKKKGKRDKLYETIKTLKTTELTVGIYESPRRVADTISEILDRLGDLDTVIARELTKEHEQIIRGRASDILRQIKEKEIKGEVVILFRTICSEVD